MQIVHWSREVHNFNNLGVRHAEAAAQYTSN